MTMVTRLASLLIFWMASTALQANNLGPSHESSVPSTFPISTDTDQPTLMPAEPVTQTQKAAVSMEPGVLFLVGFGVVCLYLCRRSVE